MRRRAWALVRMSDVIFSHQVSLPNMIYEHDCDTQLPNNLFDDEFHPDCKELPPSRPASEPTPISYMIAKVKLCIELGNILQATNLVGRTVPYDEIIRFDAKLRQVMQELPPHLRLGTLEASQDPVTLIIARYNIDILYQKMLCLLHRKYLSKARHNPRYAFSRRSAIEASLQAMDHLAKLHRESQGNGRLRSVSWYIKSIATKEFTLPAMLLVLDLHYDNLAAQSSSPSDVGIFKYTEEQRSKMIGSLETAKSIWTNLAHTSMEAFKATKIIEIMMDKIKVPSGDAMDSSGEQSSSRTDSLSASIVGTSVEPTPSYVGFGFGSPLGIPGFGGQDPFSQGGGNFMGMDFSVRGTSGSEFPQFDALNAGGPGSPLSMFTNLGGAGGTGDLASNFDWVSFAITLS